MSYDLFISHSAKDKTIADAVCAGLEAHGIRCWIAPRDIMIGENWPAAITRGIKNSNIMVLVFSSKSNISSQVTKEVTQAVNKGITISPFRIEDVSPSESFEHLLADAHWLDALTLPLEEHIQNLAKELKVLLQRDNTWKPAVIQRPFREKEEDSAQPQIQKSNREQDKTDKGSHGKTSQNTHKWISLSLILIIALIAITILIFNHSSYDNKSNSSRYEQLSASVSKGSLESPSKVPIVDTKDGKIENESRPVNILQPKMVNCSKNNSETNALIDDTKIIKENKIIKEPSIIAESNHWDLVFADLHDPSLIKVSYNENQFQPEKIGRYWGIYIPIGIETVKVIYNGEWVYLSRSDSKDTYYIRNLFPDN